MTYALIEYSKAMHASAMAGNTGYAMVPGMHALRKAIAERITTRTGVPTGFENVMITTGGQTALAAHAACDPGDTALYVEPIMPPILQRFGHKTLTRALCQHAPNMALNPRKRI